MAFPDDPLNGQEHTEGDVTYVYDASIPGWAFKPLTLEELGFINTNNLPVFIDNAAALGGGLAIDDPYKTPAGEVRVVV